MCDPVSIAGAALTAGSLVANTVAEGQVGSARRDAVQAENARQKRLRDESMQTLGNSEQDFKDFGKDQEQNSQQIGDLLNASTTGAPPPSAMLPQATDPTVVGEVGKQSGKAKAYTTQQGEALGELRGFGDTLASANRNLGRNAGWIGTLGGFQAGSADASRYEVTAANNAGGFMEGAG